MDIDGPKGACQSKTGGSLTWTNGGEIFMQTLPFVSVLIGSLRFCSSIEYGAERGSLAYAGNCSLAVFRVI